MSKYPTFERVTAGRVGVGDRLLFRDGVQDQLAPLVKSDGKYAHEFEMHGTYEVTAMTKELRPGWTRSSTYYTITLVGAFVGPRTVIVTVSSAQRLNRLA